MTRTMSNNLFIMLITVCLVLSQRQTAAQPGMKKKYVGVSAHRGAMPGLPENTLATFRAALAMQVDYIEIDVRTSKDGQLFILHDGNLDRTTTGHGPLKEKTAAELRQLSAGKGTGEAYAEERIPTLDDVCRLLTDWNKTHQKQAALYVDCKDVLPAPLGAALQSYSLAGTSVFYGTDDYLAALRELLPVARIMPGLKSEADIDAKVARLKPYAFDVKWQALTPSLIKRLHALNILVFSDALDYFETKEQYRLAVQNGIDVIQTDFVQRVKETL